MPTDKCHFYASLTAYLHLILSILRSIVAYSSLSLSWIRLHSFILCLQGKCLHLWGRVEGALEQAEQDSQWKKRDWDFGHLWDWSEAKPLPTEPMLMPNCLILQQSPALLPPTTGEKRNRTQNTTAAQDKRSFLRLLYFQIVSHLMLWKCASSSRYSALVKNLLPNKNNRAHLPLAKQKWSLMWLNENLLRGKRTSLWKMSSVSNQDKEGLYLPCEELCTVMCNLNLASGQGSWWEVQILDRGHSNSEFIV